MCCGEKDFSFEEVREKRKRFLIKLQLEYLTHKLRSIIYLDKKYADVSNEIAKKKREKIEKLSARFHIDTIFTPGYNYSDFIEKNFWRTYGPPIFQYKNDEQQRVQGNYDSWYMLYRGTNVVYCGKIMKVICNNPLTETLKIRGFKNGEYIVKYNEVSLINNFNLI